MKTKKKYLKRIWRNTGYIVIVLFIILIAIVMIAAPASAQNITFANPNGMSERDILIYDAQGQLYGLYNSTSTASINGSQDYVFAIKPLQVNPLEDPGDWMVNDAFPFVQSNLAVIIVMMFLIGLITWRR